MSLLKIISMKTLWISSPDKDSLSNKAVELAPSLSNTKVVTHAPQIIADNIESIINQATLLLEGSNEIYKDVCPLCGSKNVRRKETGEYCCEECNGVWTANTVNNLDTIWIKRIRS